MANTPKRFRVAPWNGKSTGKFCIETQSGVTDWIPVIAGIETKEKALEMIPKIQQKD